MIRRQSMCKTCIFRGIGDDDRAELAALEPSYVPCHTDCPMGGDIQCRGHFEARRTLSSHHSNTGE